MPFPTKETVSNELEAILNRHGFAYHYKVMDRHEELLEDQRVAWQLEGTEVPVGMGPDATHVDFILNQRPSNDDAPITAYLIAECKRVDPAKGLWTFARSPYSWPLPDRTNRLIQLDRVEQKDIADALWASTLTRETKDRIYDLGFEMKTRLAGDGTGGTAKGPLNEAITQVLRGVRGFIEHMTRLNDLPHFRRERRLFTAIFIPAIFTTARLFATGSNLRAETLTEGRLEKDSIEAEEKPWIWLNHNRGLNLSPSLQFDYNRNRHLKRHFLNFTRSIAVVGPQGVDDFLKTNFANYALADPETWNP